MFLQRYVCDKKCCSKISINKIKNKVDNFELQISFGDITITYKLQSNKKGTFYRN